MKKLSSLLSIVALVGSFAIHAADQTADAINKESLPGDDIQGGFTCLHSSSAGTEVFMSSAGGFTASQQYCVYMHTYMINAGTLRHDKGGNPEDCVISLGPGPHQ